jgi:RimJ/RimL family protein N-acetyltransferase
MDRINFYSTAPSMSLMTLEEAFAHPATLTTDRLRLRPLQRADAASLFAVKSDPEVTGRYGQEPHRSLDETHAWVQRSLGDLERHEAIVWAITLKEEGQAIGECCLWHFDPDFHYAELGYEMHPAYWHNGLMTEALSAVLTYGFVELGLHRVEADPLAANKPSQELLLKLGFKHEGTLRQRHFFHDRYHDILCFGLLKKEWTDRSTGL